MARKNGFYAQSGGVTAVINASACGVLETARQNSDRIAKIYAGRNGIIGALTEELIDTSVESEGAIAALKHTPGAAFGSCRHKLGSIHEHRAEYERLVEVFRAHDIGFFFYNGGGDSQDTTHKVSQISAELGEPIVCVGIPKTVDNDLAITDCSPGFGSAAKYLATSLREAAFDLAAMSLYFDAGVRARSDGPACRLDNCCLCTRGRTGRRCATRLAGARGCVQ